MGYLMTGLIIGVLCGVAVLVYKTLPKDKQERIINKVNSID
jgi:hypothetical protein